MGVKDRHVLVITVVMAHAWPEAASVRTLYHQITGHRSSEWRNIGSTSSGAVVDPARLISSTLRSGLVGRALSIQVVTKCPTAIRRLNVYPPLQPPPLPPRGTSKEATILFYISEGIGFRRRYRVVAPSPI